MTRLGFILLDLVANGRTLLHVMLVQAVTCHVIGIKIGHGDKCHDHYGAYDAPEFL